MWLRHGDRGEYGGPSPETGIGCGAFLSGKLAAYLRCVNRPVEQLQQELLVPLELELMGDPAAVRLDAADVIRLTLRRLYELPELSA